MEAQDAVAVAARLQELQFFPLGIRQRAASQSGGLLSFRPSFGGKGRALVHFTQQMAVLVGAGLAIDRCLFVAGDLVEDSQLRDVVEKVRRSVEGGASLAEAMARHPRVFNDLYVNMVAAGEASGSLDGILDQLSEFLEEWQRIRDVIVTALTYPLFLVVFAIAAVTVIMTLVVPKFASVFDDVSGKLPVPTKMLISFSEGLRAYWWAWILCVAAMAGGAALYLRSQAGKEWLDRKVLLVPLIGDMVVKVQASRFARVLGTLVRGGVPILKALEIVTKTLTNSVFARSVGRAQSGLKEGQGVAGPLRKAGVFPPLFLHMVAVGEETGKLEEMLLMTARTYDREVEQGAKRLLSLFEPIIILFVGVVIGAIILSVLWGIFSVNDVVF